MRLARPLLALLFIGLILVGVLRSIEIRRPDRPEGTWADVASLRDRDDLNLVVVLIDTLRADRLSSYGYERPTSPVLDALARTGVRFENTLAQSTWTKTSVASLLTSTYPAKNRITRFNHALPEGATLPSEILREAGFRTVGIWRNGWVAANFGFDQGFDLYVKPEPDRFDVSRLANPSALTLGGTDRSIIDAATQFIRSAGDQRFYLYLHMMDVHQYVYDETVDFGTRYSDIYDQAIHFVDANVGNLVAVLQEEGLMKKTVLAVVSDHGEAFHEHGTEGHGKNLYRETTHVPFVLSLPFRLPEPVVVKTPVENVDVWPTLLDLLGLPPLPESDGTSLLPLMTAAATGQEEPVDGHTRRFAQIDRFWGNPSKEPVPIVLIEDEDYRLHLRKDARPQLFESSDYRESQELSKDRPEVVERLRERARTYADAPQASWGDPKWVAIDEMEAAQLRALGYAVEPNAPPGVRKRVR